MKLKQYLNEMKTYNIKKQDNIKDILEKEAKQLGKGIYKFEAQGWRSINNPIDYIFKAKFKVIDDNGGYLIRKGQQGYRVDGSSINNSNMRTNASSIVDIHTIKIG